MLPSIWKRSGSPYGLTTEDFFNRFLYGRPGFDRKSDYNWSPSVDVDETDKDVTIDVELPGIDKKDVKVEVKDNTLTISGERTGEKKQEDRNCCLSERYYGKFQRSFSLSDSVQTDKISAKYKNGVLTLTLPKTEKALPKEITVEVK